MLSKPFQCYPMLLKKTNLPVLSHVIKKKIQTFQYYSMLLKKKSKPSSIILMLLKRKNAIKNKSKRRKKAFQSYFYVISKNEYIKKVLCHSIFIQKHYSLPITCYSMLSL